jgi:hypothetical protein
VETSRLSPELRGDLLRYLSVTSRGEPASSASSSRESFHGGVAEQLRGRLRPPHAPDAIEPLIGGGPRPLEPTRSLLTTCVSVRRPTECVPITRRNPRASAARLMNEHIQRANEEPGAGPGWHRLSGRVTHLGRTLRRLVRVGRDTRREFFGPSSTQRPRSHRQT